MSKPGPKPKHATPLDRTIRGCVQLTEKMAIVEAAHDAGQSESEWVRDAALRSLPNEGPPPKDRVMLVGCLEAKQAAVCSWWPGQLRYRVVWPGVTEWFLTEAWPEHYRWCELPAFGGGS